MSDEPTVPVPNGRKLTVAESLSILVTSFEGIQRGFDFLRDALVTEQRRRRRDRVYLYLLVGLLALTMAAQVQRLIADASARDTLHLVRNATDPTSKQNREAAKNAAATSERNRQSLRCRQDGDINALFLAQFGPGAAQVDCNSGAATGGQAGSTPVTAAPQTPAPTAAARPSMTVNNITVQNPPSSSEPSSASPTTSPPTSTPTTVGTTTTTVPPCTVNINGQGCLVPAAAGVPVHVNLGAMSAVAGGFGLLLPYRRRLRRRPSP